LKNGFIMSHNFEMSAPAPLENFVLRKKQSFGISPQFEGAFGRARKKPRHANAGAKVRRVVCSGSG
jgi:hypothetical protein